jgi:hypothetical protein
MRKRFATFLVAISPNCRESVRLLSAPGASSLSLVRRLGLRLHLLLCAFCRRYRRETDRLRCAAESEPLSMPDAPLTKEARERMTAKLKQAMSATGCGHRHGAGCNHR